tara:strand:+ start:11004 stop:11597 length:594 start_codon:yes stop_codon:yes gene_type:complete
MPTVFAIYLDTIQSLKSKYGTEFFNFVLMNNHFHMVVKTPDRNISESMQFFMNQTSKMIASASGRINRIYGGRYHWTIIKEPHHFAHAYKYVYQNPLRAGLVKCISKYPWSSIAEDQKHLRTMLSEIPEPYSIYFSERREENLAWLNQIGSDKWRDRIKKSLKRTTFKITRDRKSTKPMQLDDELQLQKVPGTFWTV